MNGRLPYTYHKQADSIPPMWFATAIVLVLLGTWLGHSAIEAQAFNQATGARVSVWSAMWTDLRITGQPQEHRP